MEGSKGRVKNKKPNLRSWLGRKKIFATARTPQVCYRIVPRTGLLASGSTYKQSFPDTLRKSYPVDYCVRTRLQLRGQQRNFSAKAEITVFPHGAFETLKSHPRN